MTLASWGMEKKKKKEVKVNERMKVAQGSVNIRTGRFDSPMLSNKNIYIFKNSWKTWKESCKIYSIYVNVCVIIRERILTFRITKQEICIFQT